MVRRRAGLGGLSWVVLLKVVVSVEVVCGTCAMAKADPSALLSRDVLRRNFCGFSADEATGDEPAPKTHFNFFVYHREQLRGREVLGRG